MKRKYVLISVSGRRCMGLLHAQHVSSEGWDIMLEDLHSMVHFKAVLSSQNILKHLPGFGKMTSDAGSDALVHLHCTSNLEDLHSADVIIEAIVESEDVKRKLFSELDKIAKASCILASNTSSISITRLASATNRPQQVIGMHFMNPPPIMRLVEIVRGADTSDASLSFPCASGIFRFGKTVICSQDYPGFIVNRILMPMNEAFYTLYTGVASEEDVDTGMKLGTNHPMGPLELADFIGLDVCLSIMKIQHGGLGDGRYAPSPLLVQYVDAGRLGRKRGIGVYSYRKAAKETSLSGRL
ncbi:hypothetical protein RHMOL_Rhmol06G0274100 [Rhododendron molle]|uniref:Uncharacterized protein n=1 Tax=Rhododendron molle TaxID=49168 RepID=A0ACC0NHY8_RHOML|nr:hypothetical protein RHMOL_Rhmol06G0274100 [Rhododendron molle]